VNATEDEILAAAQAILNAGGLSALSTRAVAHKLGLSPGNVSYHFPRKENLVAALVERHGERNRVRFNREIESVSDFLEMFRELFRAQWAWRGLLLALPDIMVTWDKLRANYRKSEKTRRAQLLGLLQSLRAGSQLEASDRELSRLVSQLTFVARFWISEARVSYWQYGEEKVLGHYLAHVADALRPWVPSRTRSGLEPWLEGWLDVADSAP
jgi:AcrR family transcriptional regulator